MGFTSSNAQLMTIPCYCLGAVSAFVSARFSDKYKRRMPFIVGAQTLVVIAFCIMAPLAPKIKQNIGPCYFAICLACLGFYPINPGGNAWTANNLAGPTKRAMGMAYMICMGESEAADTGPRPNFREQVTSVVSSEAISTLARKHRNIPLATAAPSPSRRPVLLLLSASRSRSSASTRNETR